MTQENLSDFFEELAQFRQELRLPPAGSENDTSTIAKLEIQGRSFLV